MVHTGGPINSWQPEAVAASSIGVGGAGKGCGITSRDDPAAAGKAGATKGRACTPSTLSLVPCNIGIKLLILFYFLTVFNIKFEHWISRFYFDLVGNFLMRERHPRIKISFFF